MAKATGTATAQISEIAQLKQSVDRLADLNTTQHSESSRDNERRHEELLDRIFGDTPTSLQSQITQANKNMDTFNERAFGDNPTSLRNRISEREKDDAVSRGRLALLATIVTFLATLFAIKWQTIAGWFGYVPRPGSQLYVKPAGTLYGLFARLNNGIRAIISFFWVTIIFVVFVAAPRLQAVWRRVF